MKKAKFIFLLLFVASPFCFADPAMTQVPDTKSLSNDNALTQEQMKDKIELLKLENENLKLKLQLKNQEAIPVPASVPTAVTTLQPTPTATSTPKPKTEEADQLREESRKVSELAKAHKGDTGLLVIDPMNGEIWYKGARFRSGDFTDLAEQENWKYTSKVVAMNGQSRARHLYQCKNISLLIYDGEEKGVLSIKAPQDPGDLDFLTSEALSFKSASTDVRDADFLDFFHYDGTDKRDGNNVLKYKHDRFLAFGDEVEFFFTHEDKMTQFRFGPLGEK
jgi:hypothetical protein